MGFEELVRVRKMAEAAVEEMPEGQLKVAAFETILQHLLDGVFVQPESALPGATPRGIPTRGTAAPTDSSGTTARIIGLGNEFFASERSLAEIQAGLAERGWHYPQTSLSTPLTRLVRKRLLRRTKVAEGKKKIWKYSIY